MGHFNDSGFFLVTSVEGYLTGTRRATGINLNVFNNEFQFFGKYNNH